MQPLDRFRYLHRYNNLKLLSCCAWLGLRLEVDNNVHKLQMHLGPISFIPERIWTIIVLMEESFLCLCCFSAFHFPSPAVACTWMELLDDICISFSLQLLFSVLYLDPLPLCRYGAQIRVNESPAYCSQQWFCLVHCCWQTKHFFLDANLGVETDA